jgi:hypothetical protein
MRTHGFWLGLIFFIACWGTISAGQISPLNAAADLAGKSLNGDWKNVNAATRGLVRIVVDGTAVHPYGSCHPTACDWGELHAQSFASRVDAHDRIALLANHETNFDKSVMTISLEPDGRLRVQTFNHYIDGSHRADASFVDYFSRD